MVIYKIENVINGKCYIGKTTRDVNIRYMEHIKSAERGSSLLLSRAIRKYGITVFKLDIICECDNQHTLNEMEIEYIKIFNTCVLCEDSNGYNLTYGGEGGNILGNHPNKDEIYKRISASNTGNNHFLNKMSSAERDTFLDNYRRGCNNPMYGTSRTVKQIEAAKLNGKTAFLGKTHSDISKKKMRVNGKGKNKGSANINFGRFGGDHPRSKKIVVIFPNGEEYVVLSSAEFCRTNNLIPQCLGAVVSGKNKQHKGYYARKYKECDKNTKIWRRK